MVKPWCFIIYLALVSLLLSCKEYNSQADTGKGRSNEFNSDSLIQVIRNNIKMYRSSVSKGESDSGLFFLQKIQELGPYCAGHDSLAAYYRSSMLTYVYELDNREKYIQAETILQELLNKPGLPWLNPFHQADASTILGNIYTRYGDYKKALLWLHQAERGYKDANDTVYFVKAVNNEVIALQELQQYDPALQLLQEAAKWSTPQIESRFLNVCLFASSYLALHQPQKAISYIQAAKNQLGMIEDKANQGSATASLYELQADLLLENGDYQKAVDLLQNAYNIYSGEDSTYKHSRDAGKVLIKLSIFSLRAGLLELAANYSHQALDAVIEVDKENIFSLPASSQLYAENTIQEAFDAKANAFQLLYKQKPDIKYLTTAVQCYTLSFEVERKLMQYFSYDESKLLMLNQSRQRSQQAIAICYQLYRLTNNNEWAEKAFQFAEKNKAFVLLESVKRNLAANRSLQEDTLYQRTQALQLQLGYNERSIAEAVNDSARRKLSEQKNKLENDLLFANTALSRQSTAYKEAMEQEDSISTGIVSASLPDKQTGLIEFFSSDSGTYAFVINKDQAVQFIRYNAALSVTIDSLLVYYQSPTAITNSPVGYQQTAYKLYTDLGLATISSNWQNLIIIPDGKLSFVPFDALVTTAATSINLQAIPWFINKCNTVYGYSAGILLKQQHNREVNNKAIAVFAPVFTSKQNGQQPLLNSRAEAEGITANANATIFLAEHATLDNFKDQFAKAGILHIATHAYADTGSNSNPKIEFIDSSLLLNELYALHTNASLVVLSACETGIGQLNKSEGPMSLARGFYYAGAKNVITSYWSVDDKSTAVLFNSFYKNIAGSTSSTALYDAKKEFIKNATGSFSSPYYWAGFVHFGLPQKRETQNQWWWWLLLPAVIVLYYGVKQRARALPDVTPSAIKV